MKAAKMPQLSLEKRIQCVTLCEEGYTQREVADRLQCSQSAVSMAVNRQQQTGSHSNRPKSGRPRVSTAREDRVLVRDSLAHRVATIPELCARWNQQGVASSNSTVRRRLQERGLNARRPRVKPLLTQRHRRLRLDFAREHSDWTWVDWSVVLFSDESKFNLYHHDGRQVVRRRPGEEYLPQCIAPSVKYGGGGVMVWGVMSARGIGTLKTITGTLKGTTYIDILGDYLVPAAHFMGYGDRFIFQEDNAPCHKARIVTEWKNNEGITTLPWPPQSPDLSPIENLWGIVASGIRMEQPVSLNELEATVHRQWARITPPTCMNLIRSMPRRIQAVIDARGGHTKY